MFVCMYFDAVEIAVPYFLTRQVMFHIYVTQPFISHVSITDTG